VHKFSAFNYKKCALIKTIVCATSHRPEKGLYRSDYPQSFRTKVRNHTSN